MRGAAALPELGIERPLASESVSRASVLLSALTAEPTTTSDLYDRIGYATLTRVGLIPYETFRAELAALAALGMAISGRADDGSTTWRRPGDDAG